jgi:non-ribosomal peptide synthase protein (TIGR01720 family)
MQEASITYGELDRKARAVAALIQSSIAKGAHIVILLPPGMDYPVAVYGGFLAGNPIVPSAPPRPGQGMAPIEDAIAATNAEAIITTSPIRKMLIELAPESTRINDITWILMDTAPEGGESGWVDPQLTPDTLAMLWLTSGSTGLPKGTLRSHGNLLGLIQPILGQVEYNSDSRVVSFSPPNFAFAFAMDMLMPVSAATPATLMPTSAFLVDPLRWLRIISRIGGTHAAAPNFAFDLCSDAMPSDGSIPLDLSSWKVALSGGEMLRPQTIRRFAEIFAPFGFDPRALAAAYGMTECGLIATHPSESIPTVRSFDRREMETGHVVESGESNDILAQQLVSVGRPIENVRCEIVDPTSRTIVSPGDVGEIWISGPGVAEGYLNRPEENEATFGGYLADDGDGPFLRTGDLGFFHDGELYVSGRIKEIIIIRGRNISPQEIELTAQRSHPSLVPGGGAAFSFEAEGEERLALVFEVKPEERDLSVVIDTMRQAVAERHEIQVYTLVLIDPGTLPRTSAGKIQRRPCRAAFLENRLSVVKSSVLAGSSDSTGKPGDTAPETEAEKVLTNVWRDLLRVPAVGLQDNFFALGGDSLLSMQMIARVRQAGWEVSVDQLLDHPTISGLAAVIRPAAPVADHKGMVSGSVPLTPRQLRYFERIHPDEYNTAEVARLTTRKHLDPALLSEAASQLLEHHDALRMRFRRTHDGWEQVNLEKENQPVFSYVDLSGIPEEEHRKAVSAAAWDLRSGLNIEQGPLMRIGLLHLGDQKPEVVIANWNHLVFDAFSMRIILDDLVMAYEQLSRGEEIALPPKTTSFKDWAERLQTFAESQEAKQELEYWVDQSPKESWQLPIDSDNAGLAGSLSESLTQEETSVLLRDIPVLFQTEINDVLLTALVRTFARWTGSRSLFVDLVTHGRSSIFPGIDLSRTVGYLASNFSLLLDLGAASGIVEELQTIKMQLRHIPNGGIGYGVLRYLATDPEVRARMDQLPEPQVMFKYDGQFDQTFADNPLFEDPFASMTFQVNPHDVGAEHLMINPTVAQGQMNVVVRSGVYVHERATLQFLADEYVGTLREIVALARTPVGRA